MSSNIAQEDIALSAVPISELIDFFREKNISFFSGVPCSMQASLTNGLIENPDVHYIGVPSEGDAVALSAGAWLGGRKSVVICQNSGLFDILGALSSLVLRFRIPLILFIAWRGSESESSYPLGQLTPSALKLLHIPSRILNPTTSFKQFYAYWTEAEKCLVERKPFVFLIQKGVFNFKNVNDALPSSFPKLSPSSFSLFNFMNYQIETFLDRTIVFDMLESAFDSNFSLYLVNEGQTGRCLFSRGDRSTYFYLVPLGYLACLALGVSLHTKKRVIAIDGDGSLFIRLGSLSVYAMEKPSNLIHVVLDNGRYASTGGQPSPASFINMFQIISQFGYTHAFKVNDENGLKKALSIVKEKAGPHLLHICIGAGDIRLDSLTLSPMEISTRFREDLQQNKGTIL